MEVFWKASALVLMGVIFVQVLGTQAKEIGVLLILGVCVLVCMYAMEILRPVMDFLYEMEQQTALNSGLLKILFKIVGIGLVAEMVSLICTDAGCGAFGKGLQILSSALILYLSIPIVKTLFTLIQDILGGL